MKNYTKFALLINSLGGLLWFYMIYGYSMFSNMELFYSITFLLVSLLVYYFYTILPSLVLSAVVWLLNKSFPNLLFTIIVYLGTAIMLIIIYFGSYQQRINNPYYF